MNETKSFTDSLIFLSYLSEKFCNKTYINILIQAIYLFRILIYDNRVRIRYNDLI